MRPAERWASLIHTCSIPVFRVYEKAVCSSMARPMNSMARSMSPFSRWANPRMHSESDLLSGSGERSRLRVQSRMPASHSPRVVRNQPLRKSA